MKFADATHQQQVTSIRAMCCAPQVQLDYSTLSREHRAVSESKAREKLASQFQADIEERGGLLAKLAPNLKAVEQYEAVKVPLVDLRHTHLMPLG